MKKRLTAERRMRSLAFIEKWKYEGPLSGGNILAYP